MNDNIFESVYKRLADDLPAFMVYHDFRHTQFVVSKASFLARQERVSAEFERLIALAALYHDTGFLMGPEHHEDNSCLLASRELPKLGLSEGEISLICGMIQATKIPQRPTTLAEKIVADADLFYLGTDRYDVINQRLYLELKHSNPQLNMGQWNEIQLSFLSQHQYHTKYARTHLQPVKEMNMKSLLQA